MILTSVYRTARTFTRGALDGRVACLVDWLGSAHLDDGDGGGWREVRVGKKSALSDVCATPTALVAGDAKKRLFASSDHGASWAPFDPPPKIRCVALASTARSLFMIDHTRVRRCRPGGAWTEHPVAPFDGRWHNRLHADARGTLRILGGGGYPSYLLTSDDDGESWQHSWIPDTRYSHDFAVDGDRLFVVGEHDSLRLSTDRGATWSAPSPPVTGHWRTVAMRGGVILVGHADGSVYRSDDLGARFTRYLPPHPDGYGQWPILLWDRPGRLLCALDHEVFRVDDPSLP